jgi:uncharacterized membrane protein
MWLKVRVAELAEDLRSSYWFVPALLASGAFAAGLLLVYVDAVIGELWLGQAEWFYGSRPEGARSLLSTVAGSTITVAGVVFSITLAAVTYASGQYGPRLLSNFVRDRGNQVTLGVFIGTFLYCLVVLRTVRSAEESSADTAGAVREAFVPHLAMFGAMALAITSIGVLIYFVHHVTDSIHINNVIARIGSRLIADIAKERDAATIAEPAEAAPTFSAVSTINSTKTGYVEAIDEDALLAFAVDRGLTLTVLAIPGDFVHRGRPMLLCEQADSIQLEGSVDFFQISRKRSALQDLHFPIDELVELAARALSPGVNDPFTAIACLDWLGAALSDLSAATPRPNALSDEAGNPRVIMRRLTFGDFVDLAFGQLRPYAAGDPNVSAHMLLTLDIVSGSVGDPTARALIQQEKERFRAAVRQQQPAG